MDGKYRVIPFCGGTRFKRAFLCLIFMLAVLCAVPVARAAGEPVFFVSRTGNYDSQAIQLTKVSGRGYYLFLPGNVGLGELKIGFTGADRMEVNGQEITGGETAEILLTKNEIRFNRKVNTVDFKVMQGSPNLPVLYVTTETGSLTLIQRSKHYREAGSLYMEDGNGKVEYNGFLEHVKMRGNASTAYIKRNYQIKLAKGTDLLGFGKAKKWILTGNWLDRTMLRNQMTYNLAAYVGLPYTPECRQAELYVNHEYLGLYLFSEKVEINEGRIDIRDLEKETEKVNSEPLSGYEQKKVPRTGVPNSKKYYDIPNNPDDITGGYLFELEFAKDRYNPEPSGIVTDMNIGFVIKSPEYATKEQVDYIGALIQGFENAIRAKDGRDPETGKHYSELMDMDSLVLKYMVNEFSQNYDSNISSEFFYKPPDSESTVAFAGPVWDLDNTYGVYARKGSGKSISSPEGLYVGNANRGAYWWPNLYKHEDFRKRVRELYRSRFRDGVKVLLGLAEDPEGKLKSVDAYAAEIAESVEMNYVRFPEMRWNKGTIKTGTNREENLAYLKTFMEGRARFLEEEWLGEAGE